MFSFSSNYTYQSFESMANKAFIQRFPSLRCLSPATLEKKFWHEMAHGRKETVEYGVNIEGSGFSSDPNDQLGNSKWNLKVLIPPSLSLSIFLFNSLMRTPFSCDYSLCHIYPIQHFGCSSIKYR